MSADTTLADHTAGRPARGAQLHVNYEFLLDYAARAGKGARVLDYGCGDALVVEAGLARGLDIVGADIFYAGSTSKQNVASKGMLDRTVFEIVDGHLPFADGTFDLVMNNQVFEHVVDLEAVLSEIGRVLRPGGKMLSLFPARDVVREGHIGIPFVHWFNAGSRAREAYTFTLRALGLGYHAQPNTALEWTHHWLRWLDDYTTYRSRTEILLSFDRLFDVEFAEHNYASFRLSQTRRPKWLSRMVTMPLLAPLCREAVRRLATLVLIATKRESPK